MNDRHIKIIIRATGCRNSIFTACLRINLLLVLFALLSSCEKKIAEKNEVAAQVGVKKLYISEISSVIPDDTGYEDSIMLANDYIKKWIKQELLIKKAEENLSAEQKDVTQELEEYRNSLIIYRYKNELIAQKMDTTVSDDQILDYYSEEPDNFLLKKNIVKAIFIKIPLEFANPEELKRLCKDKTEEGTIELRDYCIQYAKSFDIFNDHWVDFEFVAKNIPEIINDPEQFLQRNDILESRDSSYYYLVSIFDYNLKNNQAPLEYVKERIKNLILNRKKIEFLKELENNVYSEGIRKNKFKIFDIENDDEK